MAVVIVDNKTPDEKGPMPFRHAAVMEGDLDGRVGVTDGSFDACEDRAESRGLRVKLARVKP
jgi:hypothetical protein